MAKLIKILAIIVALFTTSITPRMVSAQTAPTTQAPCINGRREISAGTAVVRVPCRAEQGVPSWAAAPPTTPVIPRTQLPSPPSPLVRPAAQDLLGPAFAARPPVAPGGSWNRIFAQREAAQLERQRTAPRPYSPPPEYLAAERSPTPPTPAIALPDPTVKHFPVWFVGIDAMEGDRQAGICVLPLHLAQVRVENMSEEDRRNWCRWWRPQLSNNGSQPVDNREHSPGTANGRQADILIPRTAEWANAVVTMYGRTGQGDWTYINQRQVTERDPGASINALDLNSGVYNLLPARMSLPTARAVAMRGHGRSHHGSHRRGARRVRRSACR